MKRITMLFVAVIATVSMAGAQEFSGGFKGGMTLATSTGGSEDYKPSVFVGGFLEWRLNSVVAISPELYYSRQGSAGEGLNYKYKIRLNYLNVPVLLKLYAAEGLSFDLGPQVGFLLNKEMWGKSRGQTSTAKIDEDTNIDLSLAMGLTYNFNHFLISARYNLGMVKVFKDGDNSKNSVFLIGVGYRF